MMTATATGIEATSDQKAQAGRVSSFMLENGVCGFKPQPPGSRHAADRARAGGALEGVRFKRPCDCAAGPFLKVCDVPAGPAGDVAQASAEAGAAVYRAWRDDIRLLCSWHGSGRLGFCYNCGACGLQRSGSQSRRAQLLSASCTANRAKRKEGTRRLFWSIASALYGPKPDQKNLWGGCLARSEAVLLEFWPGRP